MTALELARRSFGVTTVVHLISVPLGIGLAAVPTTSCATPSCGTAASTP